MTRLDTSSKDLLEWILATLRTGLALNESTCFLAVDDLAPGAIPAAGCFVTVMPREGTFEVAEQTIGHVTENWGFRVRVYLRLGRDRSGHDTHRLLDPEEGMLAWKKKILRALCGKDWPDRNLRGTLAAERSTGLVWLRGDRSELEYVSFAVDFTAAFAWDLS